MQSCYTTLFHDHSPAVYSFGECTVIQDNNATMTGGAMAIMDDDMDGSTVEFEEPWNVLISGNRKTGVSSWSAFTGRDSDAVVHRAILTRC